MKWLGIAAVASVMGCGMLAPDPLTSSTTLAISALAVDEPCDGIECLDCFENTPENLSRQTPSGLSIGVMSVELLRSPDDMAPHVLLSAPEPREADLIAGVTLAESEIGSIPEAQYTQLRVTLAYTKLRVDAVGHFDNLGIRGAVDLEYAVSDHTTAQGGPRARGEYLATFSTVGQSFQTQGSMPVDQYAPPYPNATLDLAEGEYRLSFDLPNGPIVIDHDRPEGMTIQISFHVEDAFAWLDLDHPAYADDAFDVAPTESEVPLGACVRGFSLECESLFSGCGTNGMSEVGGDAGVVSLNDAGVVSFNDASVGDAGAASSDADANATDAGTTSPADSGSVDAASSSDAGFTDAGPSQDLSCVTTNLGWVTGSGVASGFRPFLGENQFGGSCGGSNGEELVFFWSPPMDGSYTIDTFGSTFDTVLYVREAYCLGSELACNDDWDSQSVESGATLQLSAGQPLVIFLDAYSSSLEDLIGFYALNIEYWGR